MRTLHHRITKAVLVRRLKWLLLNQNSSAELHFQKKKLISQAIIDVAAQNSDEDAYAVFSVGWQWHPEAVSPIETSFNKEYADVFGADVMRDWCPEIYSKNRSDDEFLIKDIISGRPMNRINPTKNVMTPVPVVYPHTPKNTLEQICLERGSYYRELQEAGTEVYMLWSGGIDSTLALHSLNQTNCKFKVIMDEDSVQENDDLAHEIISGNWPNCLGVVFNPQPEEYKLILDNPANLLVSGGNGDELFGGEPNCSGEMEHADQEYNLYIPQDVADGTEQYIKAMLEPLYGDTCLQGMTVCEWRWAVNFIYRYQQVQISSMYMLGMDLLGIRGGHKGSHFYDTEEFNIWSIQNYPDLCGEGEDKLVAKRLIYKYDGFEEYLLEKKKVCSMKKTRYRTGNDYTGSGGDVKQDVGKPLMNSYASTIQVDYDKRLFIPGTFIIAKQTREAE